MCIIWCLLEHEYYDTIAHHKKSEKSTYKKDLHEIIQPKDITYPTDSQEYSCAWKFNNIKIKVTEFTESDDKEYD